jgi:hypothetical protein
MAVVVPNRLFFFENFRGKQTLSRVGDTTVHHLHTETETFPMHVADRRSDTHCILASAACSVLRGAFLARERATVLITKISVLMFKLHCCCCVYGFVYTYLI